MTILKSRRVEFIPRRLRADRVLDRAFRARASVNAIRVAAQFGAAVRASRVGQCGRKVAVEGHAARHSPICISLIDVIINLVILVLVIAVMISFIIRVVIVASDLIVVRMPTPTLAAVGALAATLRRQLQTHCADEAAAIDARATRVEQSELSRKTLKQNIAKESDRQLHACQNDMQTFDTNVSTAHTHLLTHTYSWRPPAWW